MNAYWTILAKDLRSELRTRQTFAGNLVFSALVLLAFNFSFELRGADLVTLVPGVLWATFLFNAILALGRAFVGERDNSAILGLLLAPIDRGVLYLAKCTLSLLLMLTTELAVLLLMTAIFSRNVFTPLILLVSLLGSLGLAAVGTALSVVAFNSRARDLMLPLLLLPLSVPLIIGAVRVTSLAIAAAPVREAIPWLNLMAAFDFLFLVVCYYIFGSLVEE